MNVTLIEQPLELHTTLSFYIRFTLDHSILIIITVVTMLIIFIYIDILAPVLWGVQGEAPEALGGGGRRPARLVATAALQDLPAHLRVLHVVDPCRSQH